MNEYTGEKCWCTRQSEIEREKTTEKDPRRKKSQAKLEGILNRMKVKHVLLNIL